MRVDVEGLRKGIAKIYDAKKSINDANDIVSNIVLPQGMEGCQYNLNYLKKIWFRDKRVTECY